MSQNQVGPHNTPIAYFAMLEQSRKEDVLKSVAEIAARRFKTYRESVRKASALRDLLARDRLRMYTERQPEIWARLQSLFPHEYRDQMQDWYHLQRRISLAKHPVGSEALFEKGATGPLPTAFTPNGGLSA